MDRDGSALTARGTYDQAPSVEEGPLTGRTLGDFVVREMLRGGAAGAIYRAEQVTLAREVIIKTIAWEWAESSEPVQRFLREAQLAAQLDHPYAAHIYAFGAEPDGILWIAMELVRGTPLSTVLSTRGPMPLRRFVPLFDKICEVVYTAHQQGIVHRDIKPSNVMVISRAGRLLPKLLDFGIARLIGDLDQAASAQQGGTEPRQRRLSSGGDSAAALLGEDSETPDITLQGAALGSPPYMAPEQWVDAASADAQTDQYALGILAYEAVVGRRPFRAPSYTTLAMAHATKAVPTLSEKFPEALNEVFGRALAKQKADRYGDVLEMAAAFRTAAGLDEDGERMPELDPFVRETMLAQAPQPLADAIAHLDAARSPRVMAKATAQVVRVTVRLLGLMAAASFARSAAGASAGDEASRNEVWKVLRRLRSDRLTTAEWLKLAQMTTLPYAEAPDAHPVPELVRLLAGGRESAPAAVLAELALADSPASEENGDDREPGGELREILPKLARVLKALAFLCEYPLVVQRGGRTELWMGARRSARSAAAVHGLPEMAEGEVVLTEPDGQLLMRLSPFLQALAPAPGAADELFFFDGPGRHGARLVAFPVGFERHDSEFWTWFDSIAGARDQAGDEQDRDTTAERVPYLGLSSFSPGDAANYIGREREVEACVNRLRVEPMLSVVGPSGAGKSSFVQAGIIPALPSGWRALSVRPGPSPLAQLAALLEREGMALGDLRAALKEDEDALGQALRDHAARLGQSLVIVVDQFEELLTLCLDAEEQALYAGALARATRHPYDPVRLVITLRDDFLVRAQELSAFRQRLVQSLQLLSTPPPDELLRILVEPARRAGYAFEDAELPAEMVRAVAGEPGALALLSFTASKLWEMRERRTRKLPRQAYQALGGVGGALAQHAEETLTKMGDSRKELVREVFRQLVTADGTRAILRRAELVQMLGGGQEADAVLEELIGARLLVASEGAGGEDRVEVVHEALLSSWPRLVRWQREDAESARLRDQLRAAARQWIDRRRPKGLLWRGDALLEYRVWRARYRGSLTEVEEEFGEASLADDTRGRRRRRAVLGIAFAGLALGLAVVLVLNQRANVARKRAETEQARAEGFANESKQRLLDLYIEQGRQALLAGDPMRALVYLVEARREGADSPALRFMLARARQALDGQVHVLAGHEDDVYSAAYSPDNARIATGSMDHTVKIWDAATGALVHTLRGHKATVWMVRFSPDGKHLVTAGWDGLVHVWDPATGALEWVVRHEDRVLWADFSPDGSLVGTASRDSTAKIWDAGSGRLLRTLSGHSSGLTAASFSPNGDYLVTGSKDESTRVWRVATGELVTASEGHGGLIPAVDVSPNSALVATASWGKIARVFPLVGGQAVTLSGHMMGVNTVAFGPGSTQVITAADDGFAKIWDTRTGQDVLALKGHESGVTFADFSRDGEIVLTTGRDGNAILWNAQSGERLWTFFGHRGEVRSVGMAPSGEQFVTASFDGTARVWNAKQRWHELALEVPGTKTQWAALSPDKTRIATIHSDKTVRVWDQNGEVLLTLSAGPEHFRVVWGPDSERLLSLGKADAVLWNVATKEPILRLDGHEGDTYHAAFDPKGEKIATVGGDGTAKIWDVQTGTLLKTLEGHSSHIIYVDFDPTGTRLVTAGADKTARVWDLDSGVELWTLAGHTQLLTCARFSPDGAYVLTTSEDKTARVWTVTGELISTLEGHTDIIRRAAFHPDGRLVATLSEDRTVKVWDWTTGVEIWSIDLHVALGRSVEFSPDGQWVLVTLESGARTWSTSYETTSISELEAFAACRAHYTLEQGQLKPAHTEMGNCR